ncbi:hypothetical protein HW115_05100 [Verrucomicrobiaceae bacterium N1E253]|uniref:Uncharacterized protein n=1 Tax=Oceaniferula marina TaxID=2748318 RepID=A0A851GIE0_9BACT|nr:hypothetical protein [Oceaniferula marina]NWK54975.1 hypothetical protein [Oceaniferula marina]
MNIEDADYAFNTAEKAAHRGWQIDQVKWPNLTKLNKSLSAFRKLVFDLDIKEEWEPVMKFIFLVRYHLTTSPLPYHEIVKLVRLDAGASIPHLLSSSPSDVQELYQQLNHNFSQLQLDDENPLWSAAMKQIAQWTDPQGQVAFMSNGIRSVPSHYAFYKKYLPEGIPNYWVICPTDLRQVYLYDHLIVFGSTRRHIERNHHHIFTSPRAEHLWLFLPPGPKAIMPAPYGLAGSSKKKYANKLGKPVNTFACEHYIGNVSADQGQINDEDDGAGYHEHVEEVDSAIRLLIDRESGTSEHSEIVPAYRVKLSGDKFVLVSASGSVTRIQIDTENYTCEDVETAGSETIHTDDVLLFSTAGGGDMVAELGNKLLEESYGKIEVEKFYAAQNTWKLAFRDYVNTHGMEYVISMLKQQGSKIARETNVRNWMSQENIAPGTWRSFEAVLTLCRLQDSKDLFFDVVAKIRKMRHRAGSQLNKKLRADLNGRSLRELFDKGEQDFGGTTNLPNVKTAYFVEGISRTSIEVPRQLLNHPTYFSV